MKTSISYTRHKHLETCNLSNSQICKNWWFMSYIFIYTTNYLNFIDGPIFLLLAGRARSLPAAGRNNFLFPGITVKTTQSNNNIRCWIYTYIKYILRLLYDAASSEYALELLHCRMWENPENKHKYMCMYVCVYIQFCLQFLCACIWLNSI